MKCQVIFLISFVIIFFAAQNEAKPTEKVCEPGSFLKKDCNECKCNEDGTDMWCTRKICTGSLDGVEITNQERKKRDLDDSVQEVGDDDDPCIPGEFFRRDCNKCQCPPSGKRSAGICTLLACIEGKLTI